MIVRRRHNGRFAALPNAIWTDERLSVEAKGVLGYLLSRPHNWNVRLAQIGRALHVGKDRLQGIFRELTAAGYVSREQRRTKSGAFSGAEYIVRDEPETGVAFLPQPENPEPVNPEPVNPAAYKEQKTESNKPLSPNPYPAIRADRRPCNEHVGKSEHPSVVQARVASRLGQGDNGKGWLLFGALSDSKRDQLTAQERNGRLSEAALTEVRLDLNAR